MTSGPQGPRETQLVAVGVIQVEEALTPFGIARTITTKAIVVCLIYEACINPNLAEC